MTLDWEHDWSSEAFDLDIDPEFDEAKPVQRPDDLHEWWPEACDPDDWTPDPQ